MKIYKMLKDNYFKFYKRIGKFNMVLNKYVTK